MFATANLASLLRVIGISVNPRLISGRRPPIGQIAHSSCELRPRLVVTYDPHVVRIRDAVADEVGALEDLQRRASLVWEDYRDPWGLGVGRALVHDAAARAGSVGARRLEVTANPRALGFYARTGFVVFDRATTRFGPAPRMRLEIATRRTSPA